MFDPLHILLYVLAVSWIAMFWVIVGAFAIMDRQQKVIKKYKDMKLFAKHKTDQ